MPDSIFAPLGATARSMLMAGQFKSGETGGGLADGFRAIGWDVAEVELTDAMIMSGRSGLRVANRLLRPATLKSYNDGIVAEAVRLRPKVLVTVKGSYIRPETLRRLRQSGILTVNFYPDFRFDHGDAFNEALFAGYDLVITTKSFQVEYLASRLGRDRVAMVHHGYSPSVHRRRSTDSQPRYLWDVCYIGNASPAKLAWLEPLASALGHRTMTVVGDRWTETAAGTSVAPYVLGMQLSGDYFARAVEHSRVNVAIHMGAGGTHGWEDLVSTRSFEIPACGGFMLHVDNDEIRTLFEPGAEIDVFSSPDDLVAKVDFHLKHETQRQEIAVSGHARAVPAYSLHARAIEIATLIEARIA